MRRSRPTVNSWRWERLAVRGTRCACSISKVRLYPCPVQGRGLGDGVFPRRQATGCRKRRQHRAHLGHGGPHGGAAHATRSSGGSNVTRVFARRHTHPNSDDGTVRAWDLQNPAMNRVLPPPQGPRAGINRLLAFAPEGNRLLAAKLDGSVRMWDLQNLERPSVLLDGTLNPAYQRAALFRGRLAFCGVGWNRWTRAPRLGLEESQCSTGGGSRRQNSDRRRTAVLAQCVRTGVDSARGGQGRRMAVEPSNFHDESLHTARRSFRYEYFRIR